MKLASKRFTVEGWRPVADAQDAFNLSATWIITTPYGQGTDNEGLCVYGDFGRPQCAIGIALPPGDLVRLGAGPVEGLRGMPEIAPYLDAERGRCTLGGELQDEHDLHINWGVDGSYWNTGHLVEIAEKFGLDSFAVGNALAWRKANPDYRDGEGLEVVGELLP